MSFPVFDKKPIVGELHCPGCHDRMRNQYATLPGQDNVIRPGEVMMCTRCGHLIVAGENCELTSMTEEQMKHVRETTPERWEVMMRHQRQIRMRGA